MWSLICGPSCKFNTIDRMSFQSLIFIYILKFVPHIIKHSQLQLSHIIQLQLSLSHTQLYIHNHRYTKMVPFKFLHIYTQDSCIYIQSNNNYIPNSYNKFQIPTQSNKKFLKQYKQKTQEN